MQRAGAPLPCSVWVSHCRGFPCCGAQALGIWASVVAGHGLSSCESPALEYWLSGDGDPSIVTYLIRKGFTAEQADDLLNKESGFKGVTGYNDCRDVITAARKGNKQATLGLKMFVSRIAKYIVTYANEIANYGKIDAIVFTAGIGENSPTIIKMVIDSLPILNLKLDEKKLPIKYELDKF